MDKGKLMQCYCLKSFYFHAQDHKDKYIVGSIYLQKKSSVLAKWIHPFHYFKQWSKAPYKAQLK